ncbi:MAG: DUF1223 domain-containing protein [Cytophagales bacterium]|nr:DUF1223 domain-containing protein [Cytophagales bacterium]
MRNPVIGSMYTSVFFLLLQFIAPVDETPAEKPFVIVELFTSEGCSSCPSADKLLSEIVDEQQSDVEVIGLSFHVDYWDYIGWKDPYARRAFTDRQRAYATKLRSYQVYTPQMVVNGKHEFVGSDRRTWARVLTTESSENPSFKYELGTITKSKDQLSFSVSTENQKDLLINVAIIERGLSQQVTRGENRGRKLSHDNVVRAYDIQPVSQKNLGLSIGIPTDLDESNSSLVVYFQKASNYEIVGAQQIALSSI